MAMVLCEDMGSGIIRIILNRAPVNALSADFLNEFADTLDRLAADTSVMSVVISSDFKVLSAGLDLKEAQGFGLAEQNAIVKALNTSFLTQYAFPKPCVTAIKGAAIAGGLFFVLASDFRVAGPKAVFGLAEVRVGVDFPVGPLEIARAELSAGDLRRLMLSGHPIKADAAERTGLIDTCVPADDVLETALAMARKLSQNPPLAYTSVKRQIRGATIDRITAAMEKGANAYSDGWFTQETRPAMQQMIGQG